jgi:hypothetical protein
LAFLGLFPSAGFYDFFKLRACDGLSMVVFIFMDKFSRSHEVYIVFSLGFSLVAIVMMTIKHPSDHICVVPMIRQRG